MISRLSTPHEGAKRDARVPGQPQPENPDADAVGERASLVEGCRQGDETAWRKLFERFARPIYRWAVLLGLPPADAEEAAQEVLVVAARKIDQCRSDEGLKPWLFRITRHVVANARRKVWLRRGVLSETPPEPAFEPGAHMGREEELAVRKCMKALSHRHREVLILADVEGHTRDEIAAALGIPPGTVASRLRLARTAFRARWDEAWSDLSDMKPSKG